MPSAREKQANRRIRLLLAIFALAFAALLARGTWIQGVQAGRLAKLAHGQHQKSYKIPAGRGPIFDRTGVQLAIGEQTTTVFADPLQVRDPNRFRSLYGAGQAAAEVFDAVERAGERA